MKKKCIMFTVLSIKKQKIVSHGFYDGKIQSHKYLWSKSGEANTKEEVGRAMYTKAENGINYNRMKGVKDSTKQDVKVQLYCAYIKGVSNASDNVPGFWNDIRNKSN